MKHGFIKVAAATPRVTVADCKANGEEILKALHEMEKEHARHMLEEKDKSVTEVAATLGYFNRKYFTTCFKEEFGMTPSEFQKSQHEE